MRRLLIVDGDLDSINFIRGCLKRLGSVTHAHTKKQARRVLHQEDVHLVLLESRLPDGCGLDLLAQIRQEHSKLPTVMLTRHGSEDVCASAFRLGVTDYLKKPVDPDVLVRVVTRVLPIDSQSNGVGVGRLAVRHLDRVHRASLPAATSEDRRIREAVKFIQAHYRERLALTQVARIVGMGQFSLSRTFSTVMQVPFRAYVLRLRIIRAAELLMEERLRTVTEVAELVGFGDISRFNRMFKKYVGMPPTAYRKRMTARNA